MSMRRFAVWGAFGLAAGLAGCASTGPGKVSGDTRFEELRDVLAQAFPEKVSVAPATQWATTAAEYGWSEKVDHEAKWGFARWCYKRGQKTLPIAVNKQNDAYGEFIKDVGKLGSNPWYINEAVSCELEGGKRYVLAFGGRRAADPNIAAWYTPENLASAKPAVLALREERKAQQVAAAELASQRAKAESLAAQEREAKRKAQRLALLEKSPKGTQLTCSGNRAEDENISSLYYSCDSHSMTFADFNRYGWKVTHQSIAPGTTSRGAPVSVVSLILEKSR